MLIDGDVLAYKFASVAETEIAWDSPEDATAVDDGSFVTLHADPEAAIAQLSTYIERIAAIHEASEVQICLSSAEGNYRHQYYPEYKSNRKGKRKPLVLRELRNWMLINDTGSMTCVEPFLEADDLLGIYATMPHKGKRIIICTIDKDLRTIPGEHWNWDKPEEGVVKVDGKDAGFMLYTQCLAGDPVDGYPGIKGVGMVGAAKIVTAARTKAQKEGRNPHAVVWEAIVAAYEKAELSEEFALTQARCAYILRHGDYDWKKHKVRPWEPARET